jgi:hypothetical protein
MMSLARLLASGLALAFTVIGQAKEMTAHLINVGQANSTLLLFPWTRSWRALSANRRRRRTETVAIQRSIS